MLNRAPNEFCFFFLGRNPNGNLLLGEAQKAIQNEVFVALVYERISAKKFAKQTDGDHSLRLIVGPAKIRWGRYLLRRR